MNTRSSCRSAKAKPVPSILMRSILKRKRRRPSHGAAKYDASLGMHFPTPDELGIYPGERSSSDGSIGLENCVVKGIISSLESSDDRSSSNKVAEKQNNQNSVHNSPLKSLNENTTRNTTFRSDSRTKLTMPKLSDFVEPLDIICPLSPCLQSETFTIPVANGPEAYNATYSIHREKNASGGVKQTSSLSNEVGLSAKLGSSHADNKTIKLSCVSNNAQNTKGHKNQFVSDNFNEGHQQTKVESKTSRFVVEKAKHSDALVQTDDTPPFVEQERRPRCANKASLASSDELVGQWQIRPIDFPQPALTDRSDRLKSIGVGLGPAVFQALSDARHSTPVVPPRVRRPKPFIALSSLASKTQAIPETIQETPNLEEMDANQDGNQTIEEPIISEAGKDIDDVGATNNSGFEESADDEYQPKREDTYVYEYGVLVSHNGHDMLVSNDNNDEAGLLNRPRDQNEIAFMLKYIDLVKRAALKLRKKAKTPAERQFIREVYESVTSKLIGDAWRLRDMEYVERRRDEEIERRHRLFSVIDDIDDEIERLEGVANKKGVKFPFHPWGYMRNDDDDSSDDDGNDDDHISNGGVTTAEN